MKKHQNKSKPKILPTQAKVYEKSPQDNEVDHIRRDLLKTLQLSLVLLLLAIFFYYAMLRDVSLFELMKIYSK